MIDKALLIARDGMQRAAESVAKRATTISTIGDESSDADLANELVGMNVDMLSYKANAKVVKSVSKLDQDILDILV